MGVCDWDIEHTEIHPVLSKLNSDLPKIISLRKTFVLTTFTIDQTLLS